MQLYLLVRDQVRVTAMGDIIGLDHVAVKNVIDLYEVENKRLVFLGILKCFEIEQGLNE